MLRDGDYAAERKVLLDWASGFEDRDVKLCHEFQTTFKPCFWELHLCAFLKKIGASVDFLSSAP